MDYKIVTNTSIDDVDKVKWDNFSDLFYMKSEVLDKIEKLKFGKNSFYIQIFDGEELIANTVCYKQNDSLYANLEESFYGKFTSKVKFFLGLNPSLLSYCPYSPFYEMFKINEKYDVEKLFNIISNEMEKISKDNKCKSFGFLAVDKENLLNISKKQNFHLFFSGYKVNIKLNFNTFEEFLLSLKRQYRKTIRKEIRDFESSNYKIQYDINSEKDFKQVLGLFDENFAKYDNVGHEKESDEFIHAMFNNSKENKPKFFITEKNNKFKAASMSFLDGNRLIGGRIGQSNDCDSYAFFNLAIYEPIKYAIENKKEYYELGTGNYRYKIMRGAQTINTYSIFKINNSIKTKLLKPIFILLSRRNNKKHLKRIKK